MHKLKQKLKKIKYKYKINIEEILAGNPVVFLQIINYVLLDYSQEMANLILDNGFDLYAKKDAKFIERVYQLCLTIFKYKPKINIDQFFTTGFGDQKVIMLLEIIKHVRVIIKHKGSKAKNNTNTNDESSFNKRSSSLKPRKLELKGETKTQEFNHNNETIQSVNPFVNDLMINSSELKTKNSNNHYVALKPPKYEKHKIIAQKSSESYDVNGSSFSKENINPNIRVNTKHQDYENNSKNLMQKYMQPINTMSLKSLNENHTVSYQNIREKSKTARRPLFEFTSKVPSQSDAKLTFKNNSNSKNLGMFIEFFIYNIIKISHLLETLKHQVYRLQKVIKTETSNADKIMRVM